MLWFIVLSCVIIMATHVMHMQLSTLLLSYNEEILKEQKSEYCRKTSSYDEDRVLKVRGESTINVHHIANGYYVFASFVYSFLS